MQAREGGLDGCADGCSESRTECGGGFDGDLLPEHGSDGELEGVPCAANPKARMQDHDRSEEWVSAEVSGDRLRLCIEIEEPSEADLYLRKMRLQARGKLKVQCIGLS
jgi:hypothetical protein